MQNFFLTKKIWLGTFLITLGVFFGVYGVVSAAVATRGIGFQGQLFTGTTPVNSSVSATFTFYDAVSGGSVQGSPITKTVSVTNGYFSVAFSEADMAGVDSSQSLWVEVVINGDTLSPRSTVSSVPLANNAFGVLSYNTAPTAGPAGSLYYNASSSELFVSNGSIWSALQSSSTSSVWEAITGGIGYSGGNVGIGTTNATQALEVIGRAIIGEAITSTNYSTSALSLVNSEASGFKTQLNIINAGGGGGTATGIDFFTYDYTNTTPAARLSTIDDSNYSNSFVFSTKEGGDPENDLIERLRITSDGKVGIGTTTPGSKLTVEGDINFTGNIYQNGTAFGFDPTDDEYLFGPGSISGFLGSTGTRFSTPSNIFQVSNGSNQFMVLFEGSKTKIGSIDSDVVLRAGNSDAVTILSAGNVGIGTTNPGYKLEVNGDGSFSGQVFFNNRVLTTTITTPYATPLLLQDNGGTVLSLGGGGSYFTSNVGIGTSTPVNKLDVVTSAVADSGIRIQNTSASAGTVSAIVDLYNNTFSRGALFKTGSNYTTYKNITGNDLGFYNGATSGNISILNDYASGNINMSAGGVSTAQFTLLPSGNVGIGTSTPYGLLSINPNGITGPSFVIGSSTATNFIVTNTGNVGIGTTTPDAKLTIKGEGIHLTNSDVSNIADGRLLFGDGSSSGVGWRSLVLGNNIKSTFSGNAPVQNTGVGGQNSASAISLGNDTNGGRLGFQVWTGSPGAGSAISPRLNIDFSGNVGIGTTTPADPLTLAVNTNGGDFSINSGTVVGKIGASQTVPGVYVGTRSNNTLYFQTNNTTRALIDTSGNLGIGTSTPYGLLSINPNGIIGPSFVVGSSTATQFVVTNGGNVGIGGTNPSTLLEVFGGGAGGEINALTLRTSAGTSGSGATLKWVNSGTNGAPHGGGEIVVLRGSGAAGDMIFRVSDSGSGMNERLRISNTGNIGIGTTTPWGQLSVNPNGIGGPSFVVGSSTATNFIVTNAGNVGIGTTTPSAKFALTSGGTGTGRAFAIADSNNLDRFTVLDNGTVTVGVPATPSSLFAVNGPASVITNSGSVNLSTLYVANSGSNNSFYVFRAVSGAGDVFNVTNAGNVGIGTTTPMYKLDLRGGSTRLVQSGTPLTTSYALSVQRPDNSAAWVEILNSGGAGKGAFLGLNTNDFELYNYQAGNIIFYTNTSASASTERMRITNDGNVGIGNASPGSTVRLAINGTGTGTNTILRLADSANTAKFSFLDNGRFGIGSSTPMASFSILGTAGTSPIIVASSTGTRLFSITETGRITTNNSGSDGYIEMPTGGILGGVRFGRADSSIIGAFSWYSEPSITVHPQGYIGFNTSTSFEGGNLNGDVRWYRDAAAIVAQRNSTNAQTYRIYNTYTSASSYERGALAWSGNVLNIGTENSGAGSARSLAFMTASTTRMTIDTSGNVGIGTTTPAFPLDVYATISSDQTYGYLNPAGVVGTSAGTNSYSIRAQGRILASEFNAVSDGRLKDIQFEMDSKIALDAISNLKPVSFTWKNRPDGQPIIGFIAQDVEVVIPNAVSKIPTENFADQRSLDYNQIVTVLVGAVKEIKTKIDTLTTQVTAMTTWFRADGKLNIENDICIDDVCVTKDQFKQLLLNNGAGAHFDSNPTPSPSPTPDPTPTPTPDPTPAPDNEEVVTPSEEPVPQPEVVVDTPPVDQPAEI